MQYRKLVVYISIIYSGLLLGQNRVSASDSLAITKVLYAQQEAWNLGDIDAFMEGYWKSDQLVFSGAAGPTYGWKATRDRYINNYPDQPTMGKLRFTLLNLQQQSPTVVQLIGKFELFREMGDASGYFTLIWRKFGDRWLIVSDHTSASVNHD